MVEIDSEVKYPEHLVLMCVKVLFIRFEADTVIYMLGSACLKKNSSRQDFDEFDLSAVWFT